MLALLGVLVLVRVGSVVTVAVEEMLMVRSLVVV